MKPAGVRVCPQCGHAPNFAKDVETEQGELKLVKGKSRHRMPEKQETYSGLLWYAMTKGYKEGWAANQYRSLYEVWPKGLNPVPKIPSEELYSWIKSQQIKYANRRGANDNRTLHTPS